MTPTTTTTRSHTPDRITDWIVGWLAQAAGVSPADISPDEELIYLGLSSIRIVELTGQLGDWLGIEVDPTLAWELPTARELGVELSRLAAAENRDLMSVA